MKSNGLINDVAKFIEPLCKSKSLAIVTDNIVNRLYADSVIKNLLDERYSVHKFVFRNGEELKIINILSDILEFLAAKGLKRNDVVTTLYGGVEGDITGLATAIYMRGIGVIQIRTTLLSIVDSSICGKTAINLKNG